jgi:hypothetical protein
MRWSRGDRYREQVSFTKPTDGALNGTAVIVHGKRVVIVAGFHGNLLYSKTDAG